MKSRWEAEKQSVDEVKKLKSEIEQTHADIEQAQLHYEYEKRQSSNITIFPLLKSVSQKPKRRASSAPKTLSFTTP